MLSLLFGAPDGPGPRSLRAKPVVRAMRPEDRESVLRIEAASFPDAWPPEVLDRCLAMVDASGHVLEREGECVGFFIVQRTMNHLHLANMAVAPPAWVRWRCGQSMTSPEPVGSRV